MSRPGWQQLLRHVPVLLAGRPLRGTERHQPIFIIGSARSGTTLLRAILQAHPALHVPPETRVLPDVVRAWRWYCRLLPWNDLLRVILARFEYAEQWAMFDLPLGPLHRRLADAPPEARNLAAVLNALYRAHATRHKPGATRWGDKSPGNTRAMSALRAVFPDLRAIHLLRDGRDVVRSYMRLAPYALDDAAGRWRAAVLAGRDLGRRHPAQYLEIRYEDLVREPRRELERATGFLGVPFDDRLLCHHEQDLKLLNVDHLPVLRYVLEPIHGRDVGRWREFFDSGQVAELERLLGPTLNTLGYR